MAITLDLHSRYRRSNRLTSTKRTNTFILSKSSYICIKKMRSKSNRLFKNGYYIIYRPNHHRAFGSGTKLAGYVYEHIIIAEEDLGRQIKNDEDVHHLDFNKRNNSPENLIVLPGPHHHRLHGWLTFNNIKPIQKEILRCKICGNPLRLTLQSKYCSESCMRIGRKSIIDNVGLDQIKKDLFELKSLVKVGSKYGMSDNGIKKWLKVKFKFTNKDIKGLKIKS